MAAVLMFAVPVAADAPPRVYGRTSWEGSDYSGNLAGAVIAHRIVEEWNLSSDYFGIWVYPN